MARFISIFLVLISFTSCYHVNKPDTTPPDPLIPKEEMINILTDIYLTEGAIAYHRLQNKDKKFLLVL